MDRMVKILVVVAVLCGALLSNVAAMAHGTLSAASLPTSSLTHSSPEVDAGQEQVLKALPDKCLEQPSEHHPETMHDGSCCFNVCPDPAWLTVGGVQSRAQRNGPFIIMNYKLLASASAPPRRPPRRLI
jgi:hypothetical protein